MTQEFVTLPHEVAQQALEALEEADLLMEHRQNVELRRSALVTLRAALEQSQAEQEPVAWQYRMRPDWGIKKDCWGPWQDCTREQAAMYQRVKLLHDWVYETRQLYTRPQPAQKPLTDDQVLKAVRHLYQSDLPIGMGFSDDLDVARAIEAAHNIK